MSKSNVEVVVISLATAVERRRQMASMLQSSRLNWSFFDAHKSLEHADLVYDLHEARTRFGRPLCAQEIGVYSSQFTVLKRFLDDSPFDYVFVLEDDVIFDLEFPVEAFAAFCADKHIDYIRLFGKHVAKAKRLGFFFDRSIIRYTTSPAGAQAYLMSKKGARAFTQMSRSITATVDLTMDRFWESRLPIYSIFPYPIIERFSPTSIPITVSPEGLGFPDNLLWNCNRVITKTKKIYMNFLLKAADAQMSQILPAFQQIFFES